MTVERNRPHAIDSDPTSKPLSLIEELPNEIFGKILACFPDLVGEVGAISISAAINCKKQLELTSKKICLAVNSPRAAALFMRAIWKKYVKPAGNFTYSELAILKEGVWDKVRGHSMNPPFKVRERGVWSPLEALPDEILRKIVVSLTEVRGEANTKGMTRWEFHVELKKKEMQKTICSQISLGLASKRLHKVVHDGYTKRLFVYAVINKYKMLDFGLFVREVAAVQEGIRDYIRTCQLEQSFELSRKVHQFISRLIEAANQRYEGCETVHFQCCLYDSLGFGFEMHANSGSVTFDVSPSTVQIYCPFSTLSIYFDDDRRISRSDVFPPACHTLFALVQSLLECFDATFLGIVSMDQYGLDEYQSWPNSGCYEMPPACPTLSLLKTISVEEMSPLNRSSTWDRRGTQKLIVCFNPNFRTVYQVRSLFGKSVPTSRINGLHRSRELIRLANVVRLTLKRGKSCTL